MTVIYIAASMIGGVTTASLFGQHHFLAGVLSGPVGGSLLTALAALLFMLSSPPRKPEVVPPEVIWC